MIIAGLQKTTLIDYPGKIACIVFLAGCNFRCPWCYSAELVLPEKIKKQPRLSEKDIFDFLKARKGLIDGVVICGGEPTINRDLPQFLKKIKDLGFAVKLDSNGSNPEMLKSLAEAKLIDYVAMDIKTGPENPIYQNIMIAGATIENIKKSVEFLKNGSLDFEFRTTVVNTIHKKEDFSEIVEWIKGKNVKYYLQNYVAQKTLDPAFEKVKPFPRAFLEEVVKEISSNFKICEVRS